MANDFIRKEAKANGVALWEIAEYLHISEPTMSRKLRKEVSGSDKEKLLDAIKTIAKEKYQAET